MAAGSNEQQIIIKKKKKVSGHAHHAGAWKVAYADFVTAMMAFFLLLWLLNVTTDEQRRGIADYFDPRSVARAPSGSGGVLGGLTVGQPGQLSSPSSPSSPHRSLPGTPYPAEYSDDLDEERGEEPTDSLAAEAPRRFEYISEEEREGEIGEFASRGRDGLTGQALEAAIAEREQQQFEAAETALRQAIQDMPDLAALADNLVIDQTREGLRIQLVDQENTSMFSRGSAEPLQRTRQLLDLVAQAVTQMPNSISISGHTDATPFATGRQYDNWDLSTDRANQSRRALVEAGVSPDRIATVVGMADTQPMIGEDPYDPRNRRISIVLLREAQVAERPAARNDDPSERAAN